MAKDFFKRIKENNLLLFLFFLLVSCCLWLLQVLNEDYETDIPFSVTVNNVPDNIELVDGDDVEVVVRLSDRGTVLSRYKLGRKLTVDVDFVEFRHNGGTLSLPLSLLKKQMVQAMEGTTSIVQYHEDTLYLQVRQNRKLLPVVLNGKIDAADHYEITSVEISPVDVMVSAMPDMLEAMESVETEYVVKKYLKNDRVFTVKIAADEYMDVEPSVVDVHVSVSPMKVKRVQVPVTLLNFPESLFPDWLPNEVELSFEISESNYDMIGPADFVVTLDYNDILSVKEGPVPLKLARSSMLAKNVVMKPSRIVVGSAI